MMNNIDINVKTLTGFTYKIKYDNPDMTVGELKT